MKLPDFLEAAQFLVVHVLVKKMLQMCGPIVSLAYWIMPLVLVRKIRERCPLLNNASVLMTSHKSARWLAAAPDWISAEN